MSTTTALLGILGALLIGAISPGPSFVLVSRIAITASRLNGLAAALGMGLGGALFGTLALAGLSALLLQVEWLYMTLKLVGGAYLVYLGVRIWRGASVPLPVDTITTFERKSLFRSFAFAFATQVSNPKTAVVYGSIFAALLPASPPHRLLLALPPMIFVVEASWYALVALAFSARKPRAAYLHSKNWIDRTAGAVMSALGFRLLVEGMRVRHS
ncbi:LysE family transporter [Rhizobium sp. BK251]|uniref:LysE family translocator n=1 Tax=Rhizobium sp. BK251 TaxID=2512125 RepID=UPI0010442550|nr:LysE family transporter [Rhizobium sp. BK251]TCL73036.1 threonine/homoserine/homoserine lactone efflux protein [Rhizobium sp. BK251]